MGPRNKLINSNIVNNININGTDENNIKQTNIKINNGGKKNKLSFWMRKIILSTNNNNSSSSSPSSSSSVLKNSSNNDHGNDIQNNILLRKPKNRSRHNKYIQDKSLDIQGNNNHQGARSSNKIYNISTDNDIGHLKMYTTNSSIKSIFNKDDLEIGTLDSITNNTLTTTTNSIKKLQWNEEPERFKNENAMTNNSNNDISSMIPMISFYSSSVRSPSMFSDINSIQSTRPTVMSIKTTETNSSVMAIPPASIIDRAGPTSTLESSVSRIS